jgi:MYXO-CTERM domain-containing protein
MNMFRLSFVALVLCAPQFAAAAPVVREMDVHSSKTTLDVQLDAMTVTCAGTDLTVTAPKLAALTLMNHNDTTLGAPALTAGACEPGRMPADIIDANDPVDGVELVVKAVRQDRVDIASQSCTTYLVERVEATIRGVAFGHEETTWLGSRPIAQCNGSDSPADDPGQLEPQANSCSTSRGTSWLGLLLALGLVVRRRR